MTDQNAVRTGGEAALQDELQAVDEQVGQPIPDNPEGDGDALRRSRFIDLHGDEDGDPNTTDVMPQQ